MVSQGIDQGSRRGGGGQAGMGGWEAQGTEDSKAEHRVRNTWTVVRGGSGQPATTLGEQLS